MHQRRVAPDMGGPNLSDDGGNTWRWIGEGLPCQDRLSRVEIWVAGRELSISSDGSMVAISHDAGGMFAHDPVTKSWTKVIDQTVIDQTNAVEVQADPHTPGRFVVAADDGVRQTTDGGKTRGMPRCLMRFGG